MEGFQTTVLCLRPLPVITTCLTRGCHPMSVDPLKIYWMSSFPLFLIFSGKHTCFAGVAGPWHFAGTIEAFIARSSTVLWDGRGRHGIKEDFSGWIVGLQLCMGLYLFLGGMGLSIPFSGKTYSLYSEEMMKWCPSVGPWIVTVDGWHPHEEMQIQHMTLHVYQWNPTLCLLQHGSRTYGAKFGTSSNSSEAPWSMKSYHTQTIRVYSQGVNVGKYLKLKSSSWDKPTFHKDDRTWVYRTEPIRKWIFMAILTSWYKFATTLLHFVPQKIDKNANTANPNKKNHRRSAGGYFRTKPGIGSCEDFFLFAMYLVRSRSFLRPVCHGCHCRISKRYPLGGFGQGFLRISWVTASRPLNPTGILLVWKKTWTWSCWQKLIWWFLWM